MAFIFGDAYGILCMAYLEKDQTINSNRYVAQMVRLKEELWIKWSHVTRKVLFYQNNENHGNNK